MRKSNFLLFCLIVIITSCSLNKTDKSTILQFYTPYRDNPEFLNGPVKSVKEASYSVFEKNGVFTKGEVCTPEQRMINSLPLDFDCLFNEKGLLVRSNYYVGLDAWLCNFEYINNLMSKVIVTNKDTIRYYHKLSHDKNGSISEIKKIDPRTDSITNIYKFQMNDDGFVISLQYYYPNNELYVRKKYIRDKNNLTSEFSRYNKSDSLIKKWDKIYNEKGFYVLSKEFDGNSELTNLLRVKYTKYDNMGNWLVKIVFKNDTAIVISEREYKYY